MATNPKNISSRANQEENIYDVIDETSFNGQGIDSIKSKNSSFDAFSQKVLAFLQDTFTNKKKHSKDTDKIYQRANLLLPPTSSSVDSAETGKQENPARLHRQNAQRWKVNPLVQTQNLEEVYEEIYEDIYEEIEEIYENINGNDFSYNRNDQGASYRQSNSPRQTASRASGDNANNSLSSTISAEAQDEDHYYTIPRPNPPDLPPRQYHDTKDEDYYYILDPKPRQITKTTEQDYCNLASIEHSQKNPESMQNKKNQHISGKNSDTSNVKDVSSRIGQIAKDLNKTGMSLDDADSTGMTRSVASTGKSRQRSSSI